MGIMALFAAMRWPGLWPDEFKNFSPVYAIFFCAGVYFKGTRAWLVPVTLMFISDLTINYLYYGQMGYNLVGSYMAHNYALLSLLCLFGWTLRNKEKPAWLIGGGLVGSCIFYLAYFPILPLRWPWSYSISEMRSPAFRRPYFSKPPEKSSKTRLADQHLIFQTPKRFSAHIFLFLPATFPPPSRSQPDISISGPVSSKASISFRNLL